MDRLNRMLQAAQGMGMDSTAPGGVSQPLVSTVVPCGYSVELLSLLAESHTANRSLIRTLQT